MSLVNINQINTIDSSTTEALSGAVPIALVGVDNIWSTNHTGALIVPRGTNAEQPAPVNGQIRYNTDTNKLEIVENSVWEETVTSGSFALVDDTTPQLGGDLDVNGQSIISLASGDIPITPGGGGNIVLDGLIWPSTDGSSDQVLTTDGSGNLIFATPTASNIAATPSGSFTSTDVQSVLEEFDLDLAANGGGFLGVFTIVTLPDASSNTNKLAFATDASPLGILYSNGADWINTSTGLVVT